MMGKSVGSGRSTHIKSYTSACSSSFDCILGGRTKARSTNSTKGSLYSCTRSFYSLTHSDSSAVGLVVKSLLQYSTSFISTYELGKGVYHRRSYSKATSGTKERSSVVQSG